MKEVGYYYFSDGINCIAMYSKPSRFHRFMMRICFGFKWSDVKCYHRFIKEATKIADC